MAAWLSWLEHAVHTRRVVGSSPTAATIIWPIGQAVKTPPFHGGYRGSNPLWVTIKFGRLAQLGEHLPYKQGVIGSSPIVPTKRRNYTQDV